MDMRYALNNTQKGTIAGSPGSFVTGGRIDQIEADLLSMLGDYATSDQGVDYLKTITDAVQSADVFRATGERPLLCNVLLPDHGGRRVHLHRREPAELEHGQEPVLPRARPCALFSCCPLSPARPTSTSRPLPPSFSLSSPNTKPSSRKSSAKWQAEQHGTVRVKHTSKEI